MTNCLLEGDVLIVLIPNLVFFSIFSLPNVSKMWPLEERFLLRQRKNLPGFSVTFKTIKKRTKKVYGVFFTPCPTSTWILCVPGGRTHNSLPCGKCHRKSGCRSVHRPSVGFFFCWRHHQSHPNFCGCRSANKQGVTTLPLQTLCPENSKRIPTNCCIPCAPACFGWQKFLPTKQRPTWNSEKIGLRMPTASLGAFPKLHWPLVIRAGTFQQSICVIYVRIRVERPWLWPLMTFFLDAWRICGNSKQQFPRVSNKQTATKIGKHKKISLNFLTILLTQ